MTDRDHFAAAALTGLISLNSPGPNQQFPQELCELAFLWGDAMLRERDKTNHDAAPAAKAEPCGKSDAQHPSAATLSQPADQGLGTGDTFGPDAYRRFVGEVMNWISEATSLYEPRSDGGRRIMADACVQCWDAFDRIAYPTKNHDAAPAAKADSRPLVNPAASAVTGTGEQPAPPCVETDGLSPDSRTGQINRTPECESPRRECEESLLRDVPQDDKSRAAGGPEPKSPDGYAYAGWPFPTGKMASISRAEIDAIQHVVEDGRFVDLGDYGRLRSLLVRLRPEWEDESDRSKPISDERLAALEELSALDQELEEKHGLQGNPMIKAQRNNESI